MQRYREWFDLRKQRGKQCHTHICHNIIPCKVQIVLRLTAQFVNWQMASIIHYWNLIFHESHIIHCVNPLRIPLHLNRCRLLTCTPYIYHLVNHIKPERCPQRNCSCGKHPTNKRIKNNAEDESQFPPETGIPV